MGFSPKQRRLIVIQKHKIEKRRNRKPNDIVYFQSDEAIGFYAPKFIYVAFSEEPKKEYKASTRSVLVNYIIENYLEIKFTENEISSIT